MSGQRTIGRAVLLALLTGAPAGAQQVEVVSRAAFALETADSVPSLGRDTVSDDGRYVVFLSNAQNLVPGQVDTNNGTDVFLFDRVADTVALVSHTSSLNTAGNAFSAEPVISGDGNWVAFRSSASDLGTGITDANGTTDIFLYERATGNITVVSHASSPTTTANSGSGTPMISVNGGVVAFLSNATDLGLFTDTNATNDAFVYERATGVVTLVSHTSTSTTAGNGPSSVHGVSANGAYVVFGSSATNLGPGFTDANGGVIDIFLFERATATISLVSHTASLTTTANNTSFASAVSGDGAFVVFLSAATNVGSGITDANGQSDAFVFERATGAITLVSHTSSAVTTANGTCNSVLISRDGAWVTFQSNASTLGSGITDSNGQSDVFLFERATAAISVVSHAASLTTTGNSGSSAPVISQDGSWLAFVSLATNLGGGFTDTNAGADVFLFERTTGVISLVSHASSVTTTGNAASDETAIAAGGSHVAFRSEATNLGPGFVDGFASADLFLYERGTAGIALVSRADPGMPSATAAGTSVTSTSSRYSMSDDGRFVVFNSTAPNLVPGQVDGNNVDDVFLYDRLSGTVTLVSHTSSLTTAGNGPSNVPVISADGNWVAFQSRATDLGSGFTDTNGALDVFVWQRATGAISLVSHTPVPTTTGNGISEFARISASGDSVCFHSHATDFGFTDPNGNQRDVFVWDRATTTIALASYAGVTTTTTNGTSDFCALSGDGRYVAYQSLASNVGTGITDANGTTRDVFLYDRVTQGISVVSHTNLLQTTANGSSTSPEISADGNWVGFESTASNLGTGFTNPGSTTNIYVFARVGGVISLASHTASVTTAGNGTSFGKDLSADGRYLAFQSNASDLGSGITDGNGFADVFVYDRVGGALSLVSHTSSPTTTANGTSDSAMISRDGSAVAFRSFATNLGAGFTDANGTTDVFLFDRGTGAISLVSHVPGSPTTTGAGGSSDQPVINGDGNQVAFRSDASNLVSRDFNANTDVFLYSRASCAPSALLATPNGNNRIDLTWTSPGAYTYGVFRSRITNGPYDPIATVTGATFVDPSAQGGVTYYYIVANDCGASLEASATTTGGCQLPPDFAGAAGVSQVGGPVCTTNVTWAPATPPCGPGVGYAVYRDTSPTFVPQAANRLATGLPGLAYQDTAGVLVGTTYYYIVRATSDVNGEEDPNEVRASVTPTSCIPSAAAPTPNFDVRSGDADNTLDWVNPTGTFSQTNITYTDDGSTPVCPAGTVVPGSPFVGAPGSRGRVVHGLLVNTTTYRYAACAEGPGVGISATRESFGRPDSFAANAKWGYATGAAALATAGVIPGVSYYVVSNDRVLHALDAGTAGGAWPPLGPPDWFPYATNAPVQGRPTVVKLRTTTVMGADTIALIGSQDGRVYAINAETGAQLWASPVLGAAVQAPLSAMFTDFGAPFDMVFAGTRDPAGDSRFYALNLASGTIAWMFDNGGGTSGIGIISGQAQVDAGNQRIYFTSRSRGGGSPDTVWCLSFTPTSRVKLWSVNIGDADAGPVGRGGKLYVGNNAGEVHALDPVNGAPMWGAPWATGDGPVKGYVWPDAATGRLYFSTTGKVHAIRDDGTAFWTAPLAIPSPSPPLLAGGRLYLGGDFSRVYSIDATSATPGAPTSVEVGDPLVTKVVGTPTTDGTNSLMIVGTDLGVIFAVSLPF